MLINLIINVVCEAYEVTPQKLLSRHRYAEIVRARFEAIAIMHHFVGLEPAHIAKYMNRDRATIYHAIDTHENDCRFNAECQKMHDICLLKVKEKMPKYLV